MKKRQLQFLIIVGLIFTLSACSLGLFEKEKIDEGSDVGSINISVSHISGALINALGKTNMAVQNRKSDSRAFLVADQIRVQLIDNTGNTVSTNIINNSLMEDMVNLTASPGSGFTVEVEIFNFDNSELFPVATGVSTAFNITSGINVEVTVTCLPVETVFFEENTVSPVIDLISVPIDFSSDNGGPEDLGSETWFTILPTTEMTTIQLVSLEGMEVSQIGILYDGSGAPMDKMVGFMNNPLVINTVPGEIYYIGVVEFDIYEGPDLVTPAGAGQLSYYPTTLYTVSGNIVIDNEYAPGAGTIYISAFQENSNFDDYDSGYYSNQIAYSGGLFSIPYTIFDVAEGSNKITAFIDENGDGYYNDESEYFGDIYFDSPVYSNLSAMDVMMHPGYNPGGVSLDPDGKYYNTDASNITGGIGFENPNPNGELYIMLFNQMPGEFVEPIGGVNYYYEGTGSASYYLQYWAPYVEYYIFAWLDEDGNSNPDSYEQTFISTPINSVPGDNNLYLNLGYEEFSMSSDGGYTGTAPDPAPANINGTVYFEDSAAMGELYVMLFNQEPGEYVDPAGGVNFPYTGIGSASFLMENWNPSAGYYIISWLDEDGNHNPDPNEQAVFHGPFYIGEGDNQVEISLAFGGFGGGMSPDGNYTGADAASIEGYINFAFPDSTGNVYVQLFDQMPGENVGPIGETSYYNDGTSPVYYYFTNWEPMTGYYIHVWFEGDNEASPNESGETGPIDIFGGVNTYNINLTESTGGMMGSDGGFPVATSATIEGYISFENTAVMGEVKLYLYDQQPAENVGPIGSTSVYYDGTTMPYYSFTNWEPYVDYYISAWIDENSNEMHESTEQSGFVGPYYAYMGTYTVDINLMIDSGGDDFVTDGNYYGADSFSISGYLYLEYPDVVGDVVVMLFDQYPGENSNIIAGESFYYDGTGSLYYNFTNWAPITEYFLVSWVDTNGNETPDADEQSAIIEYATIYYGSNTYNLNLTTGAFVVEGIGSDGGYAGGFTVSGNVSYPPDIMGQLYVGLYDVDPFVAGAEPVGGMDTSLNPEYSFNYDFTNWMPGNYWIGAFIDENSNGLRDGGELYFYSASMYMDVSFTYNINL